MDHVVFPIGKEAEADAYLAWCQDNNPDPTAGATWEPLWPTDKYGQRAIPFPGPTGLIWYGEPFPEPQGGATMRADAVLVTNIEWPVEEL